MFTHFLTSTKLTPVYSEAQSLTLCACPGELLLQCARAHGVCYLHPPPTYLGWSWILCPPVSHFLPVSLTAFTVTSVSCVTLICLGMGKNGRWSWGRDTSPSTYLASCRHQGPLTRANNWWGI